MRDTFEPLHWKDLHEDKKAQVLQAHLFLKLKRDGTLKARSVARGNRQRHFITKEEASSPTASTEAVLYTGIIDAKEQRNVMTFDVPNAFITTRVKSKKDKAILRYDGHLVDVLTSIHPEYKKYVRNVRGKKVLIVRCNNAIYGTMKASLLYYQKFVEFLDKEGFTLNPYDPCVANKMVNGKQQTIVWHVDDCKVSHVDEAVNEAFIERVRQEFEEIFEDGSGKMKVTRGKVHDFLGMTLDYNTDGLLYVHMFKYLKEVLTSWEKLSSSRGLKETAAPANLYVVRQDAKKLDAEHKEGFHSHVQKMLFAAKRARPDSGTAVAFHTTRVMEPDEDDWSKFDHLMKYPGD